uniref:Piwi domain-containing protein n=1 Tax=Globodera pallida TaxID=36090 RepID=A0A183CLB7_GLOPA
MKHRRRLGLAGLNNAQGIARGEKKQRRRRWADPLVTMATENGQAATLEGTAEQSAGGKESVASTSFQMAYTVSKHMLKLNGTYWMQEPRVTTAQMTTPMVNAVKKALMNFNALNGCFPEHIFVFRAGASEEEYKKIAYWEGRAFETAFAELIKEQKMPFLTMIACQRNSNYRIIPQDVQQGVQEAPKQNCQPGTVLDKRVAVLYGIECTHKYFAVKNYWRAFFATTCAALIFRFANAVIIPPHIAGTITAYYQTSFPNEVFLVEEIPVFVLVGLLSGLFGALFVVFHRRIAYFKKRNRTFRAIFGKNSLAFTIFMALIVGIVTFPDGLGRFIAGKYTFRETLGDFIANCSMSLYNVTSMGCGGQVIQRWTIEDLWAEEGPRRKSVLDSIDESTDTTAFMPNPFPVLFGYLVVNFFLVAICITLALPAGIFVPSFVIGACGGRIIGELMVVVFPEGIRGLDGPQIYPGLYAVVGAAAYTGAVTHSLSIAVIVCETTGQLSALLPVLIALMVANAVSSFLQPSIYESIINIRKLPHLAELPPSRISVHTLKVEQIMVRDVVFVTKQTTYKELRELLICTPHLRSYPLVTDEEERILLGSVARKYLHYLLTNHLGPDPALLLHGSRRRKSRNPSGFSNGIIHRNSTQQNSLAEAAAPAQHKMSMINDRNLFGNTLLSISPLHDDQGTKRGRLMPLLMRHQKEAISLSQTR